MDHSIYNGLRAGETGMMEKYINQGGRARGPAPTGMGLMDGFQNQIPPPNLSNIFDQDGFRTEKTGDVSEWT